MVGLLVLLIIMLIIYYGIVLFFMAVGEFSNKKSVKLSLIPFGGIYVIIKNAFNNCIK